MYVSIPPNGVISPEEPRPEAEPCQHGCLFDGTSQYTDGLVYQLHSAPI